MGPDCALSQSRPSRAAQPVPQAKLPAASRRLAVHCNIVAGNNHATPSGRSPAFLTCVHYIVCLHTASHRCRADEHRILVAACTRPCSACSFRSADENGVRIPWVATVLLYVTYVVRMKFVCNSSWHMLHMWLVCIPYVICMSLYVVRMLSVCNSYVIYVVCM